MSAPRETTIEKSMAESAISSIPAVENDEGPRGAVWIVDDSPLEAEMSRRALVDFYDVTVWTDGWSVLERLAQEPGPDLIVLDWNMPTISGMDVCRFIRTRHDEASLPIVILTASSDREELIEGLRAGANDFVPKTSDPTEIRTRVATLFRAKRLLDKLRRAEARAHEARIEAESANRAKDEFLALVSHELRTPLSAILGWSRMLRSGQLEPSGHTRALEAIERNALVQVELIDDILDVARIVAGKLRLEMVPVDFASIIGEAIDAARPGALAKAISIESTLDPAAAPLIADPNRLRQIVSNLLNNALKFTPRAGRIEVRLRVSDGASHLTVKDTGRGIAPELLQHIFERLRQAEGSAARTGGLGLGLSLVRNLVELHGGTITSASAGLGQGATFSVILPIPESRATPVATKPKQAAPEQPHRAAAPMKFEGVRMLVVDDDDDTRELLGAVLRSQGAEVTLAASVAQAIDAVRRTSPAVLLSDIMMAGADGYDLIRAIRALPPDQGGNTPAAALTGHAGDEARRRALAMGFQVHIIKPVEPSALIAAIALLLPSVRETVA
jgi:signal transduction histidine kinase